MAFDRTSRELRQAMDARIAAEQRSASEWQDPARQRIEQRHLLTVHVQDRALAERIQRADQRIERLLREL